MLLRLFFSSKSDSILCLADHAAEGSNFSLMAYERETICRDSLSHDTQGTKRLCARTYMRSRHKKAMRSDIYALGFSRKRTRSSSKTLDDNCTSAGMRVRKLILTIGDVDAPSCVRSRAMVCWGEGDTAHCKHSLNRPPLYAGVLI